MVHFVAFKKNQMMLPQKDDPWCCCFNPMPKARPKFLSLGLKNLEGKGAKNGEKNLRGKNQRPASMAWCAESVAGQTSPVGATSNFNRELCCQKFRKIISYSLRMLDKLKENQVWTIPYLFIYLFKMIFLSANFYVFQCHVNYITREASPMYPRPLHTSEIPCEAVGTKITLKCNSKFMGKGEKKTSRKNVTKKKRLKMKHWKTYQRSEKSSEQTKNVWVWFTNFLFKLAFGQHPDIVVFVEPQWLLF